MRPQPRTAIPVVLILAATVAQLGSAQTRDGYIDRPGGAHLYYFVEGQGADTVVYLHGGPGGIMRHSEAKVFASLFARHTFIFYQQRGAGLSNLAHAESLASASAHVEDLEALRQFFHLRRMTLLGHSWGGGLLALYAAAYPSRIARGIQVSSLPLRRPPDFGQTAAQLDMAIASPDQRAQVAASMAAWRDHPDSTTCTAFFISLYAISTAVGHYRDSLVQSACQPPFDGKALTPADGGTVSHVTYLSTLRSLGDWDLTRSLRKVRAPILIIRGEDDFFPLESAQAYARAYPNAGVLQIAGAGHVLAPEQPGPFLRAVATFLSGDWPEGVAPGSLH